MHRDYARRLLPYAVGYSSALIEYFFRTSLQVEGARQASDVRLTVTNASAEGMGEGCLSVHYDSSGGTRKRVPLGQTCNDGSEGVPVGGLAPGTGVTLPVFVRPSDFATGAANQFFVVFRGQLGAEPVAVGGRRVVTDVVLRVNKTGSGSGRVASAPGGIDCGASCSAAFKVGTSVSLQAIADAGSVFSGWSGSCSGTEAFTAITLTDDAQCDATFTSAPTLAVVKPGTGSGRVTSSPAGVDCGATCAASFAGGATVNLTAIAEPGSRFVGWGGDCSGTLPFVVLTMTGDRRCAAIFSNEAITGLSFSSDRVTGRVQIWRTETDALGSPAPVTTAGSGNQESRNPDWSVATGRIAYQFGAPGVRGIHMVWPDGREDVRLTVSTGDERDPSWSPDGQFIVYSHQAQGTSDYDLWIHRVGDPSTTADDEDYPLLTMTPSLELRPAWSPDGGHIAFVSSGGATGTDAEIAIVGVAVTNGRVGVVSDSFRLLTNNTFTDFDPSWAPDSKSFVFSTTRSGGRDIYRMSADCGASQPCGEADAANFVRLTTHAAEDTNPAWSPGGRFIAFASQRSGDRELYLMPAAEGEGENGLYLVRVTVDPAGSPADDDAPAWRR